MRPRPRPRKTPRGTKGVTRAAVGFNEAAAAAAENPWAFGFNGFNAGCFNEAAAAAAENPSTAQERNEPPTPFNEAAAAAAENPGATLARGGRRGASSMRPRPRPRKTPQDEVSLHAPNEPVQ